MARFVYDFIGVYTEYVLLQQQTNVLDFENTTEKYQKLAVCCINWGCFSSRNPFSKK